MLKEMMGTKRAGWLVAAVPCGLLSLGVCVQSAQATNYGDVLATQMPLLYWPMNEAINDGTVPDVITEIDNLDLLLGAGNFANSANLGAAIGVGGASMRPSAGFDGFDETNTTFNFNTTAASSVMDALTTPKNSIGMIASSVSMWVNTSDPSPDGDFAGVLWRGDEGSGHNLNLRLWDLPNGNGLFMLNLEEGEFITISNGTDGSTDYSDGQWHHVAATWEYDIVSDAGMLNLYIDGGTLAGGEQVSTAFDSTSYAPIVFESDPENNPGVFDEVMDFDFRNRIGKGRVNAHRYNGDLDEAAIWNRTLTAAEVAAQYDAAFEEGSTPLVGDLDLDGFVGITDLNLVLSNWNENPPDVAAADPSGDGFVGIEDLNVVLGNWNAGTPPTSVVPEPATLALLSLSGLAVLRRR